MKSIQLNQNLDEQTRMAYLQAIDITCWAPKNSVIDESLVEAPVSPTKSSVPNSQESIQENPEIANLQLDSSSLNEGIASSVPSENSADAAKRSQEDDSNRADMNPEVDSQAPERKNTDPYVAQTETAINNNSGMETISENEKDTRPKNKHFLKRVNWSNPVLSEENAKSLLIVCRHQKDQPANSFARPSSPSQFMMDFINALVSMAENQKTEFKVQLAHLSAAGLSDDCVPLSQVMKDCRPDLILTLGDETVNYLINEDTTVAKLRGQLNRIDNEYDSIASYHPYSLIKNPSLKKLALEDLSLVCDILTKES